MKMKITLFILLLMSICFSPITIGVENPQPVGFGPWTVIGLFPSVSEDGITCYLIGPFLGKATLNKSRFYGHIGLVFLYGKYQWFADGPPVFIYYNQINS